MADYICIDGGTTNTRLSLVRCGEILDTVKLQVGARSAIGNPTLLEDSIRSGIVQLLKQNDLQESRISCILAAGMITSEFGLYELPHITAPAGLPELRQGIKTVALPHISSIPFRFIPGIKTPGDVLENADMMRGEEAELAGLFRGEGVYVLPGSHSKIIFTDATGAILDFRTMLTGEMLAALAQNTILRDAVELGSYPMDEAYLLKGYEYAQERGINEALFRVRILKNRFGCSPAQVYWFFMGTVLCDEIACILAHDPKTVVIGGTAAIKEATAVLLQALAHIRVITVEDEQASQAAPLGMLRIYESR